MVIGRSTFLTKSFASQFVVKAAEAVGVEKFVDAKDIAVLLAIVWLVEAAVEIADDNGTVVLEVWRVFAEDFLGYLWIQLVIRNVLAFRWPYRKDKNVSNEKGNSVKVIGMHPS